MAGSTTSSVTHVVRIVAASVRFASVRFFEKSLPSQQSCADVEVDSQVKERFLEQEHSELSVHGPLHSQPGIGVLGHPTDNTHTSHTHQGSAGLDRLVADWQVGVKVSLCH